MSARDDEDYRRNPIARALTDAGYRRCERLWVTQSQYEQIVATARKNGPQIERIKEQVRAEAFAKGGNA